MNILLKSIIGVIFAGATFAANDASAQQLASQGWQKICSDQGKTKICNTQYQLVATNRQVIAAISLAEITGENANRLFQVTVPTNRSLLPGVEIQVDDKKPSKLEFILCTPVTCIAELELTDSIVGTLKGGSKIQLSSVNASGTKTPVEIPLSGFGQTYDGNPLTREQLEESVKAFEEKLTQKVKTTAEKLLEAQEKAKEQAAQE